MANTQELRRKIKSISSTAKLTKAMQMVSASKMNRATTQAVSSRAYAEAAWSVISRLATRPGVSHPFFARPKSGRTALILMSSNRGLAGGFNSQVIRHAVAELTDETDVLTIGRKGQAYFRRFHPNRLIADFPAPKNRPSYTDVTPIAQFVGERFLAGEYSTVKVIYNRYESTIRQVPSTRQLLPMTEASGSAHQAEVEARFEPSPEAVLSALVRRMLPTMLYQMLVESTAAEHSARMVAMKNATDNAKELVSDLTLTYQGVRQANITRQIIEIASGAAALAQ